MSAQERAAALSAALPNVKKAKKKAGWAAAISSIFSITLTIVVIFLLIELNKEPSKEIIEIQPTVSPQHVDQILKIIDISSNKLNLPAQSIVLRINEKYGKEIHSMSHTEALDILTQLIQTLPQPGQRTNPDWSKVCPEGDVECINYTKSY